jgi:hypothetical protein
MMILKETETMEIHAVAIQARDPQMPNKVGPVEKDRPIIQNAPEAESSGTRKSDPASPEGQKTSIHQGAPGPEFDARLTSGLLHSQTLLTAISVTQPAEEPLEVPKHDQSLTAKPDLLNATEIEVSGAPILSEEDETGSAMSGPADGKAAESWKSLASTALEEPDDELRGEAVQTVGLYRHDDAVAVLLKVALSDQDPDIRFQAFQSLWYSAADGLDTDGTIRETLEAATNDPDERIAELAKKAILDLDALKQSQQSAGPISGDGEPATEDGA